MLLLKNYVVYLLEGFKDEIRGLLKTYGADSLSKLDPKNYSALMEEAGGIGID